MSRRVTSLFVTFLCLATAVTSVSGHAGQSVSTRKSTLTAERLNAMDIEELEAVGNAFVARVAKVQNIIKRNAQQSPYIPDIMALGDYPILESLRALFSLARSELKRVDTRGDVNFQASVLIAAVNAIAEIGTASPTDNIHEMRDLIEEAAGRFPKPLANALIPSMIAAYEKVKSRDERLINLNDLIEHKKRQNNSGKTRLERIEAWMNDWMIGQPEVVQGLLDLEWRSELYGKSRSRPDLVYLMGLPGSGKDTAAEVFTDALHGYDGAHKNHLFRIDTMKNQAAMWKLLGSATGYVGSENFPPFLSFAVMHSGGKYRLDTTQTSSGKTTFKVIDNPEYKGELLPGYYPPEAGVVFLNEFHNWAKQNKDDFVKQALEKGYFTINNPNGGLSEIFVPLRFVIASNEGIDLITAREANGQRFGKPLTYTELLSKWEQVHDNKASLKNAILATNGGRNTGGGMGSEALGTSEELLNRIPNQYIFLMRPLSPENLQKIVEINLNKIAKGLGVKSNLLGRVRMKWTHALVQTIQDYDYVAEDNARPIEHRVNDFVEQPIMDAVKSGTLKAEGNEILLDLDIVVNPDNTRSLEIKAVQASGQNLTIVQPIRTTLKDRPIDPITDERIEELAGIENVIKANVFGIDPIIERMAQRIISIENNSKAKSERPANLIMLTGLSSTGKTEAAKQLYRAVTKSTDPLPTFDFSNIQTMHDFRVQILGIKDGAGNPIPSEFMKQYDRNNGRIVVAFDELANVRDPDLLKSLYDLFREPVMTAFSDGRPREMGGVVIIITGNAGQELYNQVPTDIPMEVQMEAWAEIYKNTSMDQSLQRKVLERYYPEPLITRIGRNNIFFVPPHTYQSLRQLTQLKLGQAIKQIADTSNRRGWQILFPTNEEYSSFIDMVIDEGFSLKYQGASIDSFVRDDFKDPIESLLTRNKVPSGTNVVVKFRSKTENTNKENPGAVIYDLYIDGFASPIEYKVQRPYVEKPLAPDEVNQLVTGAHEAGHSIVRQVAFKDAYIPTGISVIPGVTLIGDRWIYYAGLAQAEQEKELSTTRDWVVSQIAVLAAGEIAERLVARGEAHSTGKQNDMERATSLARNAIIKFGLSEKWGMHSVPTGTSTEDYILGLSEEKKKLLESETEVLVLEGRMLALRILEANFNNAFVPLYVELVEKGKMERSDLEHFYKEHNLVDPHERTFFQRLSDTLRTRIRKWSNPRSKAVNVELDAELPRPAQVADIRKIAEQRKQKQYDQVELPESLPVGVNEAYEKAYGLNEPKQLTADCAIYLEAPTATEL